MSLLSVNPSQPVDDSAAAEEQGPRFHRGIPSKLKHLSDHRCSSDADHIIIQCTCRPITKNEDGHRLCCQHYCGMISPRRHYACIAWPTL